MGDDLAKLLYQTHIAALGGDPADLFLRWELLRSIERLAWESVATKARAEVNLRLRRDMRDARDVYGAEQALANL